MSFYKTKAMVIKARPFGEADKLLTLFSKEKGKITVVARGGRRARSSFGGRLELFAYNEFFIAETKGLHILSQVESIETFHKLRENWEVLQTACYLARLIDSVSPMGKVDFQLFRLLLWSLHLLSSGVSADFVARVFEAKLSLLEGVFPSVDHCVKCGKKPPATLKEVGFSFEEGGIVCSRCAKLLAKTKIPYEVIRKSRDFALQKFQGLEKSRPDPRLLKAMEGFLGVYLRQKFEIDWQAGCGII